MKKWQWFILGLLTYLVFLIFYMPAIHVIGFVQEKTNNIVDIENVGGTVFSGTADSITYDGLRVLNVNWSLSVMPLFYGKVNLDINGGSIRNTNQIYVDSSLSVSLFNTQNISIENTQIFVPAKPLFSKIQLPVVITAAGRFRVDIDSFNYEQGCQSLKGTGNWLQALVNVNANPVQLGTFDAILSCDTPAFVMQITPDNGISLDANITLDPAGTYSALGTFAIPANYPQEIKQGAQFFGEPQGNNAYKLNVKGKL